MIKVKDKWHFYPMPARTIVTHFTNHVSEQTKWMSFLVPSWIKTEDGAYNYFAENCSLLDREGNQEYGFTEKEAIINLFKTMMKRYKGLSLITSVDDDSESEYSDISEWT